MKNLSIISRELVLSKMYNMGDKELRIKCYGFSIHLYNKHQFHVCRDYLNDIPDHDLKEFYLFLHEKYTESNQ